MVYNTERKRKNKNLLINAQGGFCGRSSIVPTLTSKMGTGGDNIPLISYASQSYADWKISNIGATLKSSGGIIKEFIKFLKGENIPTNEQIIITVKNYFDE